MDFGGLNFNIFMCFRGRLHFNIKIAMLFEKVMKTVRYIFTILWAYCL